MPAKNKNAPSQSGGQKKKNKVGVAGNNNNNNNNNSGGGQTVSLLAKYSLLIHTLSLLS